MKMADVQVGMRLREHTGRIVTVTELTARGFKYTGAPYGGIPRLGIWFTGEGEHFGFHGETMYLEQEQSGCEQPKRAAVDPVDGRVADRPRA